MTTTNTLWPNFIHMYATYICPLIFDDLSYIYIYIYNYTIPEWQLKYSSLLGY